MNLTTLFMTVVGMVLGALLGAGVYAWILNRKSSALLRLPRKWPLASRVLVTNEEHEVLNWLRATFPDHLVMIKLPVLRFTVPVDAGRNGGGQRWQTLLNSVYCSFTVCTTNGNVVGCVDMPGKRGLSKVSVRLKESLLSDCRIAYTVVRSASLPKSAAMRAAFLGEMDVQDRQAHQPTRGGDSLFHADLDSFTRQKRQAVQDAALLELNKYSEGMALSSKSPSAGFNSAGTGSVVPSESGRVSPPWEDSFVQPEDSRPAKLS